MVSETLSRPDNNHSSTPSPITPHESSNTSVQAARQTERRRDEAVRGESAYGLVGANRYESLQEDARLLSASSNTSRTSTIVARGQIDGVKCVDMLIDTGASCCFVRRSCAERMKLQPVPLKERVTVTLADRRTTVATHEVRASSLCVHGSRSACSLLVMDELSNEVIVGLNWQRAAGLTITPGHPHDLLNGQPVRCQSAERENRTRQSLASESPASAKPTVVDDEWQLRDKPVRLSAALIHPRRVAAAASSECRESLSAADVADLMRSSTSNSQLRQVLQRHSRVFTETLPVKTAEQIAQSKQFSIVLIGDSVRPVKQRERRLSPAEIEAANPVGARGSSSGPHGAQQQRVGGAARHRAEA